VISIKTRIPLQRLVRRLTTPQSSLVEKSITRRLILIIAECLHGRRYSDLQLCIEYIHGLLNGRWLLLKRQLGAIWNDMLTLILFILKFIINIPASHHLGISNKFSLLWVLATAVLVDSICQVHQNRTFFLKLIWWFVIWVLKHWCALLDWLFSHMVILMEMKRFWLKNTLWFGSNILLLFLHF